MINFKKRKFPFIKGIHLLIAIIVTAISANAQAPDTAVVNRALAKYKNEHAVYLDYTQHIIIEVQNGNLVARNEVRKEKLFITPLSTSICAREDVQYSFLYDLDNLPTASAYIPEGKVYKRIRCKDFGGYHPTSPGTFYDDDKGIAVLYSGLTKNSVTETKYTMNCAEIAMLPMLFFQEDLPVLKSTIEITFPNFVSMDFVMKGENTGWIKEEKEEKNNNVTYKFIVNNAPPAKNVNGAPSALYYLPHVISYITTYTLPGESKATKVLNNPDHLYRYMYKFIRNVNIAEDTAMNRTVAMITKNDATQRQKAMHIYDWVQKHIHYVGFEDSLGGWYPRQASMVYKRKFGDCKDMASITMAMCRKAGLKAYFTWIGTQLKPYSNDETPIPFVNNHMICAVKLDNDWVFLDGTDAYLPLGETRDDIQGKEAFIAIDEDNYLIVKIPMSASTKNTIVDSTYFHIISNKSIEGNVAIKYSGSPAWELAYYLTWAKNDLKADLKDYVIKMLTERGNNKFIVTKYDVHADDYGQKEGYITADFNIHDYMRKAGGQQIVNMNLNKNYDELIDTTKRNVAYYFPKKEKIKDVVTMEIPKGSGVVYVPHAVSGSINNVINYKFSYKVAGRKITLVKEIELKTLSVDKKQFAAYNKLVNNLRNFYKESVILTAK